MKSIPVIDISAFLADPAAATPPSRAVVDAVRKACEEIGFFVITGHGVPDAHVERIVANAKAFFALALEEKLRVKKPDGPDSKGYTPMGTKTVGKDRDPTLKPSLHESYAMGPYAYSQTPYYTCPEAGTSFAGNHWPAAPAGLKDAFITYYQQMERLGASILHIFARALDVPDAYFDSRIDKHTSILRAIHYPALREAPKPGEERSAAHTDTTAITILSVDDAPGGLQVQTPSGDWIDVKRIPGSYVINIGDIMMRWTNDRFLSTMHRVVNPPPSVAATAQRISVPYFLMPNYDAVIECIPSCLAPGKSAKYPPVTSGQLLAERLTVTFSKPAEQAQRASA
jgi:isopenicillin N synthase-like dioxygenase